MPATKNLHQQFISAIVLFTLAFQFQACVQPTKKQEVNFVLNAKAVQDLNSIGVRGGIAPLSWNEDFVLQDADQDSIFTGTVTFDVPFDYVELKFVKNGGQYELDGQDNRKVYFEPSGRTTIKAVFDKP